jgi:hypothetical protein
LGIYPRGERGWGRNVPHKRSWGSPRGSFFVVGTGMGSYSPAENSPLPSLHATESMRHMLCYATMPWIDTVKWLAKRSQRAANDLSPQSWSWSAVGVEPLGLYPSAPLTPETHLLPEKDSNRLHPSPCCVVGISQLPTYTTTRGAAPPRLHTQARTHAAAAQSVYHTHAVKPYATKNMFVTKALLIRSHMLHNLRVTVLKPRAELRNLDYQNANSTDVHGRCTAAYALASKTKACVG